MNCAVFIKLRRPFYGEIKNISYQQKQKLVYKQVDQPVRFKFIHRVSEALILGTAMIAQATAFAPNYNMAVNAAIRLFQLIDRKPKIDSTGAAGLKLVSRHSQFLSVKKPECGRCCLRGANNYFYLVSLLEIGPIRLFAYEARPIKLIVLGRLCMSSSSYLIEDRFFLSKKKRYLDYIPTGHLCTSSHKSHFKPPKSWIP